MNYCNPAYGGGGQLSATDIAGASLFYGGPRSISTLAGAKNEIDTFYRGSNGQLTTHWRWGGIFGGVGGPLSLGCVITSDPVAVSWGRDRIDVFARGADAALWHIAWDGVAWSKCESLGGGMIGSPAAVARNTGQLDVFVRGTDNVLQHKAYNGTVQNPALGFWSQWERLPLGGPTGTPTAVSWDAGRLDVFVRMSTGVLGHVAWEGAQWVADLPGGSAQFLGSPSAASWAHGRIDIVVKGMDYGAHHIFFEGGWSGYHPVALGQGFRGNPTLVATKLTSPFGPPHVLDVVVRGTDDFAYSNRSIDGLNFTGFSAVGVALGGTPSAGRAPSTQSALDVLVRGTNGHLFLAEKPDNKSIFPSLWDLGGSLK
jgi:hypothetical protein